MSGLFDSIWFWVLVVLVILIAIYFPGVLTTLWGWVTSAWGWLASLGLPWWGWCLLALGLAYAIDPEGTTQFIHDVVGWVGDLIGDVVGAAASGLFSSPIGILIAIGLGVWLVPKLFKKKDDEPAPEPAADSPTSEAALIDQRATFAEQTSPGNSLIRRGTNIKGVTQ